jgi:MraZ protein
MFIGEYGHNLDQKGRLAIPVKFRALLMGGAVVTRGLDRCLFLFPKKDWLELAAKLIKLPISQANARAFSRLMLAGAMDVELDKQGRILIPDYLRTYAELGKRAVVAGLFNRIEIWDSEIWENYKEKTEREAGDIAEKLGELGI